MSDKCLLTVAKVLVVVRLELLIIVVLHLLHTLWQSRRLGVALSGIVVAIFLRPMLFLIINHLMQVYHIAD